jgi:hypothetical protein
MTAARVTREKCMTDNIIQFTDPKRDPVRDKLARAHEDKAVELGVEFTNWGWGTDENGIVSKTTKGILSSSINPSTMEVHHQWTTFDEKARNDEQFQRDALEHFGEDLRRYVLLKLKPLREVFGDLTEFAAVWEAIDKFSEH